MNMNVSFWAAIVIMTIVTVTMAMMNTPVITEAWWHGPQIAHGLIGGYIAGGAVFVALELKFFGRMFSFFLISEEIYRLIFLRKDTKKEKEENEEGGDKKKPVATTITIQQAEGYQAAFSLCAIIGVIVTLAIITVWPITAAVATSKAE